MFHHLFARLLPGRPSPRRARPYRLGFEQLEDRQLLSAMPAAAAVQTQLLANPTIDGTGATLQYIPAGNFQTVASQAVTVAAGQQTGLFQLNFQAQAWSGITNRVGVRYLVDGQFDPNDSVMRSGTGADTIEDVSAGGWQTLYLTRLVNLSAGTHTILVQVYATNQDFSPTNSLAIYAPVLGLVAFNTVDNTPVAAGIQVQTLASPIAGNANRQTISTGSWQTVSSTGVTVGPSKTGLYDLTFQAVATTTLNTHVAMRYLIDGKADPHDVALGSNGPGADATEDFLVSQSGQWHTLLLSRQIALTTGAHTIAIQVMTTTLTTSAADLTVYTPVLSLVGYNTVDGQHAADLGQSQAVVTPVPGTPGQQDITAGSWQTVARLSVPVSGLRSGLYQLSFQAQAQSNGLNRVYVQYLVDGKVDASDAGVSQSASEADAATDFASGVGSSWHTLSLLRLLNLTPGTHTIAVQVWAAQQAPAGPDLVVTAPILSMTGFNNITPTAGGTGGTGGTGGNNSTFNYDPATQVLTINGTSGNDQFRFSQVTLAAADGSLGTVYTFTVNNSTRTYTSAQLSQVVVNGNGGSDTATLVTNDTYKGADGLTHETLEQAVLGPNGGLLQKLDATGNATTFLQLKHFARINAYMGYADRAQLIDSAGADMFVSAGLTSYMTGSGYYNYVTGAATVTASSTNGGRDVAYQYDGSGASTFTATGVTSSTMTGLDQGKTFTNTALGFHFTYGVARHTGDVANLYDSPGNDVFIGAATSSYLYSYTGKVETMHNTASGFSHVNAFSTAGGTDNAFNHAPSVNTVTGFKQH